MPTQNALPDAARFADDLARLTGGDPDDRYGLAVSGGPDSVAMLLLATAHARGRIEVATVDHGLRPDSAREARFVADLCAKDALPHEVLELAPLPQGNVSANARAARYAALETWRSAKNLDWVLTAHHADDQLETVIMRLNRGSGVSGLAGIRASHGRVVRPLLGWRRAELAVIVANAGIEPVDDPSNRDDRYDRARLRKALHDADWLDPLAVTRSASALADADAALRWVIDDELIPDVTDDPLGFVWTALPDEIIRRQLVHCIQRIDPACKPRGPALDALIAALQAGRVATIGRVLCDGIGAQWTFTRAPPRRAPTPPEDA